MNFVLVLLEFGSKTHSKKLFCLFKKTNTPFKNNLCRHWKYITSNILLQCLMWCFFFFLLKYSSLWVFVFLHRHQFVTNTIFNNYPTLTISFGTLTPFFLATWCFFLLSESFLFKRFFQSHEKSTKIPTILFWPSALFKICLVIIVKKSMVQKLYVKFFNIFFSNIGFYQKKKVLTFFPKTLI